MSTRRALTKRERNGLYAMLAAIEAARDVIVTLQRLGWQPPDFDLQAFDDGHEVIRALALDTHSLVRTGEME